MRQTSFADFRCALSRSLDVIGDWWTPLIVRDLALGLERFEDLVANLGVSRNVLAARLTGLVEADIVERDRYCDHPPRHRYRLTAAGKELVPILVALTAWGDRWTPVPDGPPLLFHHDGHRCTPTVACSACREPLTIDTLEPVPGPGAGPGPGTRLIGLGLSSIHESHEDTTGPAHAVDS